MTGPQIDSQQDLDDLGAATRMLDELGAKPYDYNTPEGLDGTLEALKGFMRPSAAAGRSLMMAGAPAAGARDSYLSSFATPDTRAFLESQGIQQKPMANPTATQDAYFRDVVEGVGGSAVDYWTPDPVTLSGTAKAINLIGNVAGSVPQMIGTPGVFLASAGLDPSTELVRQGVDAKTAMAVGGVNLAVNAAGMRLPAAFGSTLTTRLATGAGSNLALGIGADAASGAALRAGGYEAQAESYNPKDPYSRALDVMMGLAFGGAAHVGAAKVPPAQRDAVLVARNADHIERGTMPGEPLTPAADIQHQSALTTAMQQVLSGQKVDVAAQINPSDYLLRPELAQVIGGADAGRVIDARLQQLAELSQAGRLPKEELQSLQARDQEIRDILRRENALKRDGVLRADPAAAPDIAALAQEQIAIKAKLDGARNSTAYATELKKLQDKLGKIDSDAALIDLAVQMGGTRPRSLAAAQPQGYAAYRRILESGGRPDAQSPTSSAVGIDQFTDGTWLRMVSAEQPAWAEGMTQEQILAARSDPAKSGEMATALDRENAAALARAGQDATVQNLYAAHHFGQQVGVRFAAAAAETPVDRILTPEQIEANPYLKGKTKAQVVETWDSRARRGGVKADGELVDTNPAGQALRERLVREPDQLAKDYAALTESQGGVVLNTDTARELSPEYLADRTRSADVHEAASDTVKMLYERKLAEPTPAGLDPVVMFTAGGTGAGKTTGLQAIGNAMGRPEIIYDTNMNTLASAVQKVEQALQAGRDVRIAYVYRDPVEALTAGAIPRAQRQAREFGTGRTVPLQEHARTHAGVRGVMEALAERYAGDKRVEIVPIDNSRGKGKAAIASSLADLPKVDQNGLYERLNQALEEARAAGLDERTYRGFAGQAAERPASPEVGAGTGGQPQPERVSEVAAAAETPFAAATRLVSENPGATVIDGFDADGNPIYRPLAEALADIEAERKAAARDADGVTAAANCAIRRGPDAP